MPRYTHFVRYVGHKWHHFNVTDIWSKQAMHWITSTSLTRFCRWRYGITDLMSNFQHSTTTQNCSFEIADKVVLLEKTLNTSLMAFLIHKRLWNFSYVRHNKLTFYDLRRTISNFPASNFNDCVCKVMVVSKRSHFCIAACPFCRFIAYSSWRHFLLNKRKIYMSYYVDFEWVFGVFHLERDDSTWRKPNHNLGH